MKFKCWHSWSSGDDSKWLSVLVCYTNATILSGISVLTYPSSQVCGSLGLMVLMVRVCCRLFPQAHSSPCRSNGKIIRVCVTCLQRVPPLSLLTYPASTLLLHIASRKHTASIFEDGAATQGHKRQPSCTWKHVLQRKENCNILTQISTWEHCHC